MTRVSLHANVEICTYFLVARLLHWSLGSDEARIRRCFGALSGAFAGRRSTRLLDSSRSHTSSISSKLRLEGSSAKST